MRLKVLVVLPVALVAVTVYVVASATTVGVPAKVPVDVLKVIPAGSVGDIAKLAIVPPVEITVKPTATILTSTVSVEEERVNAGAANAGVPPPPPP